MPTESASGIWVPLKSVQGPSTLAGKDSVRHIVVNASLSDAAREQSADKGSYGVSLVSESIMALPDGLWPVTTRRIGV